MVQQAIAYSPKESLNLGLYYILPQDNVKKKIIYLFNERGVKYSAYLHHRLVFIHPFNNGNGRWARLVINIFLKDQLNSYLRFPEAKLLLTNEIRKNYINALQEADKLNYQNLIAFHKRYISKLHI